MRSETAANLPSEIAKGNFYRLTDSHYQSWMEEDTKQKVGFVKEQIGTAVVDSFRTAVDDLALKNATPAEKARAIFAMSASNRDFLEMSGQEQNQTIFALASEYALKGDKELVRELLSGSRVGADGRSLPPLSSIPAYSVESLKVIEQAGDVWNQKAQEDSLAARIEANTLVSGGAFTAAEAAKRHGSGIWSDGVLSNMVEQSAAVREAEAVRFAAADAKREQRFQSNQEEQAAAVETLSLLTRYGGATRIKDVDVIAREGDGYRTISRQTLIDNAVGMFENQMSETEQTMIANGTAPEAAAATVNRQRLAFYSANKLDNAEWFDTLNGIASRASIESLLERGAVSQEMLADANLYRELKASNPAYLSTLLTDPKAKEFLEVYDAAVTTRRMPPEGALHFAAAQVAKPETERVKSMLTATETDDMAKRILREMGVDERASNYMTVATRITDMSLSSFTKKEIEQNLRKEIEDTSVSVHGMLVTDHRDLPDDFPELMELELQAAYEVFGKAYGLENADDLYVVPVSGQSKWQVVSKSLGGMPIGTSYVTPQSLSVQRDRKNRDHDAAVLALAQAKDGERATAQRTYDERVQYDRDQIAKYRGRDGFAYQKIADYLEGVLNDRLARDKQLREMTAESIEAELDKLRKAQEEAPTIGLGGFDPAPWGDPWAEDSE